MFPIGQKSPQRRHQRQRLVQHDVMLGLGIHADPVDAWASIQADQAKPDEVANLVRKVAEHFGHLDILVNNAGVFITGPVGSVTAEAAPTPAYSAPGAHVFAPSDDPFDLSSAAPSPAPALVTDPFQPTNDELDPLKQLKGRPPASAVTAPKRYTSSKGSPA